MVMDMERRTDTSINAREHMCNIEDHETSYVSYFAVMIVLFPLN